MPHRPSALWQICAACSDAASLSVFERRRRRRGRERIAARVVGVEEGAASRLDLGAQQGELAQELREAGCGGDGLERGLVGCCPDEGACPFEGLGRDSQPHVRPEDV